MKNVHDIFYEDNGSVGFDEEYMGNRESGFASLHHLAHKMEFNELNPKLKAAENDNIDYKQSFIRLRVKSIEGPVTTLSGAEFNGPGGKAALTNFIKDNMPQVVDNIGYEDTFNHTKVTKTLVSLGTQIGYNQAAILNEQLWRLSTDTDDRDNYLKEAIKLYFLCLDFEKVNLLGASFEESREAIDKRGVITPMEATQISVLIEDARECKKLKISDPLFEYVCQIQSSRWTFDNIKTIKYETLLQRDELRERSRRLLQKLNRINPDPMNNAKFKFVERQHEELKRQLLEYIDTLRN